MVTTIVLAGVSAWKVDKAQRTRLAEGLVTERAVRCIRVACLVAAAAQVVPPIAGTAGAQAQPATWRVSTQPILQIGSVSGDAAVALSKVVGAIRTPDGRTVVANSADNSLRFFSAEGRHIVSVGRTGQGPREFSQMRGLFSAGNQIWVPQLARFPIHIFSSDGAFARSVSPVRPPGFGFGDIRGVLDDGSVILSDYPQGVPIQKGVFAGNALILVMHAGRILDTIATAPAARFVNILDSHAAPQEYGAELQVAARGSTVYYGFPDKYEIVATDASGRVLRRITRAVEPQRVTDADKDRFRARIDNLGLEPNVAMTSTLANQRRELRDHMLFPVTHPVFRRLYVDASHNLWVERHDARQPRSTFASQFPATWDVFGSSGAHVAQITLPERFVLTDAGSDFVLGVWRDDSDVEYVRMYRLLK